MKKLFFLSTILAVAALSYSWAYPAYIESCKKAEQLEAVRIQSRLEHENLLREKVALLDDAIEKFENQSGLRTDSLNMLDESATPPVLRHRIRQLLGEKWSYIEQDVEMSLQKVIMYQFLLDELGQISDKNELKFRLTTPSRDKAEELHARAQGKVEEIREDFRRRAQLIDLMVWADVPEWQRNNLRTTGKLKLN